GNFLLTIFTVPKAFEGKIDLIQQNAIASWKRLGSDVRIFICGDENGIREIARKFEVDHISQVYRNGFGTPLLNDVFSKVEEKAEGNVLCFINTDVILMEDFTKAVETIDKSKKQFLMIGECHNVTIDSLLNFDDTSWKRDLQTLQQTAGKIRGKLAMDYFVFNRGLYQDVPQFAIGRARYDNWLVWKALKSNVDVIDASMSVNVIHQFHDYSHFPRGRRDMLKGPEAKANQKLAGLSCFFHLFSLYDATHVLCSNHIRKRLFKHSFVRQFAIRLKLLIMENISELRDEPIY
ncbi:hypothetical protein ACFL27_22550, partial [candidate division CSSED10-310 bacterium]